MSNALLHYLLQSKVFGGLIDSPIAVQGVSVRSTCGEEDLLGTYY